MPRALHLYATLVGVAGILAAAAALASLGPGSWSHGTLLLVALGTLAQVFPVSIQRPDGERHTISFTASFALALLYLGQPVAALVLVSAGGIGLALRLRLPLLKLGFNIGHDLLCVVATIQVLAVAGAPAPLAVADGGDWMTLLASAAVYLAVNEVLMALIFTLQSGERWWRFPQHISGDSFVLAAVVPVIVAVYESHPVLTLLLVLPFAALEWSRMQMERHAAERLELQRRLEQSERMEAIGRLAGGVAHDFNNLLSVILSASDFILSDAAPDSTIHADASDIQHAGRTAAAMTKQLLIFSRRETLAAEVIDPAEVLGSMRSLLRRSLGDHIELEVTGTHPVPPVSIAPSRFEQLVLNLVVNARDAMPEGGSVVVELGAGPLAGAEALRLRVIDTGCGISPEIRRKIFEPFFTSKKEGRGTGLGLATVLRIVTDAGGTVDVESTVGQGTTFEVLLPGCAGRSQAASAPESKRAISEGFILIVDDDAPVRAAVSRMLERAGLRTRQAGSGAEALALVGHERPLAVLTDVLMPEMTGPRLARELRAAYPELPIVFMTGFADDVLQRSPDLARYPVLQKPFSADAVLDRLEENLAGPDEPAAPALARAAAG